MSDLRDLAEDAADGRRPLSACAKIDLPRVFPADPPPPLVVRAVKAVRDNGWTYALRRTAEVAHLAAPRPEPVAAKPVWRRREDEALGLHEGDKVVVKSAEEIRETLDAEDRYKGLLFMSEMWKYCGEEFTVLGRIERIFSEATNSLHSGIKNTVLLDAVNCDGADHGECGARCYHLWREVWLRRPDGET